MTEAPVLHCINHPDRETTLRCAKCNAPICAQCARRTPTGYICPACQRGLQKKFETALWYDYPVGFIVSALGAFIGSLWTPAVGGIFFYGVLILFYAPFAGGLVGRISLAALRRRRGRRLFRVAAAGFLIGGLILPLLAIISLALIYLYGYRFPLSASVLTIGWQIVYLGLAFPAFYTELTGIRLKR